jgi:EAL domain-containing protein (putative c-di-GMP-specific phosphodiesterase class I)
MEGVPLQDPGAFVQRLNRHAEQLKALGFRFALHDFNADPQTRSLLEVGGLR